MPRVAIILFLFVLSAAVELSACSCLAPLSPEKEYSAVDAVFTGRAYRIDPTRSLDGQETFDIRIEVLKAFKGVKEKSTVAVRTPRDEKLCGFPFKLDKEYLVFGYWIKGIIYVGECSGTQELSLAAEALNVLERVFLAPAKTKTGQPEAKTPKR